MAAAGRDPPRDGAQLGIFDAAALPMPDGSGAIAPAARRLALPAALAPYRDRLRLGTSSWSFPGWQDLVYAPGPPPPDAGRLARDGLAAYAAHPLLGAVGIDRSYHAPLDAADHARYAAQVPPGFRFLVKAPAIVTDPFVRDANGRGRGANPAFLDATTAIARFVEPAVRGLDTKLGTLLFQFPPQSPDALAEPRAWVDALARLLAALPRPLPGGAGYAVELRDAALLTPRLVDALRDARVDYCVGLHDRMPPPGRQLRALDRLHGPDVGPLLVRWSLRPGIGYEAARRRYAPFRALVDPDPATRAALAARAAAALRAGHPVTVIANNKAEGSAPLTLAALADAIADAIAATPASRGGA